MTMIRGSERAAGAYRSEMRCIVCGELHTPSAAAIRSGPETYRRCESCRREREEAEG
jgi:hypothetical protein